MGEACRLFDTPVTGGNVSFYNENPSGAVFPTPTIGMLGVIEDVARHTTTAGFKRAGNFIYLLAPESWAFRDDIGGSEYLTSAMNGSPTGDCPHLDLSEEKAVHEAMLELIKAGSVASAHDISDGGLAICLAECAIFADSLGCEVDFASNARLDATLFGESQSRIVFTSPKELNSADLSPKGVQIITLGKVTPHRFNVTINGDTVIDLTVDVLRQEYRNTLAARIAD